MSDFKSSIGTRKCFDKNPEVINERVHKLKTSRSSYIGSLTKYVNRLSVKVAELGNESEVEEILGKLSRTFAKILEITSEYVTLVEPDEKTKAES